MRSLHCAVPLSALIIPLAFFSQPVSAGPMLVWWILNALAFFPGFIGGYTSIGVFLAGKHPPHHPKRATDEAFIDDIMQTFNSSDPIVAETKRWLKDRSPGTPLKAPPGVPQYNFDMCVKDMGTSHIVVTGPVGNNGVRIDGVPPTCMVLSTVLVGNPVLGPHPIPMGSASLMYDNLTDDQYNQLKAIFDSHKTG